MVSDELLARYDEEMRRNPVPDAGSRVERHGSIVRMVGESQCVLWAELTPASVAAAVAEQARYLRQIGAEGEWKVFGHDRSPSLESALANAGFVPGKPETLVVFDLRQGVPGQPPPDGVTIRRVVNEADLRDAVAATVAAFGSEDDGGVPARYGQAFRDPRQALFVAYADGTPVSAGRLEMPPGRSFASLWGGGTAPGFRHRGVYRGLVHVRALAARDAGYPYLTVDAEETSRPILERLGFVPLTTTRAWTLPPESDSANRA